MKNSINIFITVFLCFTIGKAQQNETYQSLMMKYFQVSGIDAEYDDAYDGMVKMLQDAYQTQEIPAATWQKIYDNKAASVAKFKGILASEYRSIFEDKQDLRNLITFFSSDTGIQYKKNRAGMTEDQLEELQKFKQSNTGLKLFGRIQQINHAKETASVYWSRELICTTTTSLKKMGFQSSMHMPSCN